MREFTITGCQDIAVAAEKERGKPTVAVVASGDDAMCSDGYHTFGELYDHRHALWIALCRAAARQHQLYREGAQLSRPDCDPPWRSRLHSDGTGYGSEWFLLGIGTAPGRQITYHLPERLWDRCAFAETLERGPKWDGHTPADVLKRLGEL